MCYIPGINHFFVVTTTPEMRDNFIAEKHWQFAPTPVNTDYQQTGRKPKLIIVCESPSDREVECGYPCAHSTGGGLTAAVSDQFFQGRKVRRSFLPRLGYYLTNVIRYQADFQVLAKPNGRRDRTKINPRLSNAWRKIPGVAQETVDELAAIAARPLWGDTPILFATGTDYPLVRAIREVTRHAAFGHSQWIRTWHPSAWGPKEYPLVNPDCWGQLWRDDHRAVKDASPAVREGTHLP